MTAATLPVDHSAAPAHNVGDIIAAQMAPFREGGVSVKGYGREPTRCPICKSSFDDRFECPNHNYVRPKRVRVQVTGIDAPRGFVQVYSDFDGNPLNFVNAPAFMAEVRRRLQLGTFDIRDVRPGEKERLNVGRYAHDYIKAQVERSERPKGARGAISKSHYDGLEKYMRLQIVPHFGHLTVNDFTKAAQVEQWIDAMVDGDGAPVSDTVCRKAVEVLRHFLNWSVHKGDRLPLQFEFPIIEKGRRALVTASTGAQDEIVAAFEERYPDDVPFIRWTAKHPHRTNENRAFRVRDFSLGAGIYRLVGAFDNEEYKPFPKIKDRAGTEYEMDDEDVAIIATALAGRDVQPDDYLFVNRATGGAYTHAAIDSKFRRVKKIAGYPELTLEQFGRHSWVKQRLDEGWDFTRISHYTLNSVATLQRFYANVTVANRRKVVPIRTKSGLKNVGGGD